MAAVPTNFDRDEESNLKDEHLSEEEKRKSHKELLEEIKRKGREELAQNREERKTKREEKSMAESDSPDEEDYYIRTLSAMSISLQKPEKVLGTGLVYDELMLKHKNDWDPNFPEKPERISEPFKRCSELHLVERCIRIETQYGTEDMVLLQHTRELLEKVKSTSQMNKQQLQEFSQHYDSVYCNQASYECALVALGSTVELMEQILKKKITNGLAITRPPGHHSMNDALCGFCIFNNVAIAAKHAVDNLGVKKVLIVDWDVHHGQATQKMFYDDPRVLYFSIHRYEYGNYWPNLRESDYDFIGKDKGLGFNINVPLNQTGMTDKDYLAVFHQVLLPVAYEFCPDLILVSAGYDCAIGCPEGEMMVSPACFGHMTHYLMGLADGRVCVCLEGGYCIKSLSESVALTLKALLRDPCPLLPPQIEPSDSVAETILNVIKVLRPHWSCFHYQDLLEDDSEDLCSFEEVNKLPPRSDVKFNEEENDSKMFPLTYTYPEEVKEVYFLQKKFDPIIDQLIAETALMRPPYRTCIVYDDDMRAHKADSRGHPEDPDRITRIFDKHVELGLLERCLRVQSRHATESELQLIHSSKYVEEMKELPEKTVFDLRRLAWNYNSIYLCQETYNCALLATGSLLNVVHTVLTGQASSGVAVVRPPGHHAECTKCMGFCFFNNVAIAAKYAQEKFGLKRVLILDWDVHHGNGTQHQFYQDNSVLLINLHRYDYGCFYPSSEDGSEEKVGEGEGEGYNVNIAWNHGFMGDAEYIAAFHQIVMPIASQYSPELVLVSAGFDSAIGDPLGGYMLSPSGYAHMTHMLSSLANGRVILSLEGGYNLTSISHSMCMCTSVLLGDSCPSLQITKPMDSAIKTIKNVCDVHKNYWKGLKFRVKIPDLIPPKDQSAGIKDDNKKNTDFLPLFDSDIPKDGFTGTESGKGSHQGENKTDTESKSLCNTDITKDKTSKTKDEQVPEKSSPRQDREREGIPEGKISQHGEEMDKLASATASLTVSESPKVFSEKVEIHLDHFPEINFIQILRAKQKTLEAETKTKLFLRGQALETRGVEHTEKILYVHIYSEKKENVRNAVQMVNEIKDTEIESVNRRKNTENVENTSTSSF
ncbi:histone deacetylase 6-like isoform X3 [Mytilus californianus]|uniref:histone deacetylase 6-like isoform X3 n=1 Tax=Mytilus californianus TaxID=6549 RepID=UPI002246B5D9|nr:histone deacetylase 6-like isoform X3 [Mytilus californianus]